MWVYIVHSASLCQTNVRQAWTRVERYVGVPVQQRRLAPSYALACGRLQQQDGLQEAP